jgi:hypothetical protein
MKSILPGNRPEIRSEEDVLATLKDRGYLLPSIAIATLSPDWGGPAFPRADALITAAWRTRSWSFACEVNVRSTPLAIDQAMEQARKSTARDAARLPLVCVPYLNEEAVQRLEEASISGVDLCGNGILIDAPGGLLVRRTGHPNLYPYTVPVRDPFSGQAGVVVRQLTTRRWWTSLSSFHAALAHDNRPVSLSLCSKVISQLAEMRLVNRRRAEFGIRNFDAIAESLREAWIRSSPRREFPFALPEVSLQLLAERLTRRWVITGGSSVSRYALMPQGGPIRIYVEDVSNAWKQIGGAAEKIPSFANLVVVECRENGVYSNATIDEQRVRWASPLQTWIELKNGDARQQDTAAAVYRTMLEQYAASAPAPPEEVS